MAIDKIQQLADAACLLDGLRESPSPSPVLLFKRILAFPKSEGVVLDKRGAKRYPVGARYPLKAKITLVARDGEGHPMPAGKSAPMDWGGQLVDFSESGANIRLHPAAIAAPDEVCTLKLELDHMLFETEGTVTSFQMQSQYVTCGLSLNFPDKHTRKAYQQLMAPVVVGSTLEAITDLVKQDLPGLVKEQYHGEADGVLSTWREGSGKGLKLFELLLHDYYIRGNTELPGLKIGYRDGAKVGSHGSTPAIPVPLSREHQAEVTKLYRFVVQNLTKSVPSETRKFLEIFAA